MNEIQHYKEEEIEKAANTDDSERSNTTVAAMLDAGLSRADLEEAMLAEFRLASAKKKQELDEIEIEFGESHVSVLDAAGILFTEHDLDTSVHTSLMGDPATRDPKQVSCNSSPSYSSETSRPAFYRLESSRSISTFGGGTDHHRARSNPSSPVTSSDDSFGNSERSFPRPGAVHSKNHPDEKAGAVLKVEIQSELTKFDIALRLERMDRDEKMRCRPPDRDKCQSEDVGSSIHSGHRSGYSSLSNAKVPDQKQGSSLSMSSSHRRLGQQGVLRSSSHRRLQTETYSSSSSRRASVERRRQQDNGVVVDGITAGDLQDRLAPSRPSLRGPVDQMNSTRSLMERGSSRRGLYERTSSRRLGTEIDSAYRDSLEDDEPLPSWTLNARPRPSEYVRSPPQTEQAPSQSRRRGSPDEPYHEFSRRCHSPPDQGESRRRHSPPDQYESRRQHSPPEHLESPRRRHSPPERMESSRRRLSKRHSLEPRTQLSQPERVESRRRHSSRQRVEEGSRHSPLGPSERRKLSRRSPPDYESIRRRTNPSDYEQPRRNSPSRYTESHRSRRSERHSDHHRGRHSPPDYENSSSRRRTTTPAYYDDDRNARGEHTSHPPSHSSRRRSSSSSVCQPGEVEISPNVWMALRGANETWSAVANGFYAPTMCLSCASNLLVILDAELVLCPSCRVVSPIMDDGSGFRSSEDDNESGDKRGVGLGFTVEDLMRWQDEMARGVIPQNGFT